MRRAQGASLDGVTLAFDRRKADRGYGYVGASRARRATDLFVVDAMWRTDWLPVNGDPSNEQLHHSVLSEKDSESDGTSMSDFIDDIDDDCETPSCGRGMN